MFDSTGIHMFFRTISFTTFHLHEFDPNRVLLNTLSSDCIKYMWNCILNYQLHFAGRIAVLRCLQYFLIFSQVEEENHSDLWSMLICVLYVFLALAAPY